MKIVGLITEYNPFHNGHKYHIEQARKITGADYVIAVMSGDFVQRGAPAFLPKHLRAKMALDGGCDMVLELPVCYATGSAEYFAYGAVSLLDRLGCVDSICFGSECGDYDSLLKIAQLLVNEPSNYKTLFQDFLRSGMSFPLARQHALREYFNDSSLEQILESPNNILGIEYIKALLSRKSKMNGFTITRKDSSYHDTTLSSEFSSASAIRHIYTDSGEIDFELLDRYLPNAGAKLLKENYKKRYPVFSNDLSLLLRYRLLSETKESLTQYMDINTELANRIINSRNHFMNFEQFCDLLKTRELTYARISRCLLHILLNIQKSDLQNFMDNGTCMYARILGFKKNATEIFSHINQKAEIPLITNPGSLDLSDDLFSKMLSLDIYAADLYENIISSKYDQPFINELTQQIIKE